MAAAENGALPRGKVGGVGDVVRDLPLALAELSCRTTVLTPEYGLFADTEGAHPVGRIDVHFAGEVLDVTVIELPGTDDRVRHLAFQHPRFAPQGPGIYCHDGADRPFANDATKFALFSAAVATWVGQQETPPDVVHLHDWHAALYLALRAFDPAHHHLHAIRTVYTIHNLALQGVRPLDHDESSLAAWFHDLPYDHAAVSDRRYPDCVNPMATAIRLAEKVNTVSPAYAMEILLPNDQARAFRGGEGLEEDLQDAVGAGRLAGILNGCMYPRERDRHRPGWRRLLGTIEKELRQWRLRDDGNTAIHDLALERVSNLPTQRPPTLLTSIGRLTDQKAALFLQATSGGKTAIEHLLEDPELDGIFVLLGSGDPELERRFGEIAADYANFLFLCGYSETFSHLLYKAGDLFLMPSSFEPCGISQMLAMRAAQPCVVHAVGGLKDTVLNEVNGFTFDGHSPIEQADHFVATTRHALVTKSQDADRWLTIRHRAAAQRFSWRTSAERYIEAMYE